MNLLKFQMEKLDNNMEIFIYCAKNIEGKNIFGKFEGDDCYDLLEYIHEQGYYLIYWKAINIKIKILNCKKLNNREISLFSKQFHTMINSGISVIDALMILYEQPLSNSLKINIKFIIQELKKGESLFKSLLNSPIKFPRFFLYMIKIGEESGSLDFVLEELHVYYEKEHKLVQKVRSAMLYPIIVCVVTTISTIFLMVKIVPSITSVLTSLGGKIPVSTSIIIALSEALKKNFLNILLCILLSILLLGYYMRKPTKKDFFYKILFRLPFIGHLYKKVLEVKILRSLSILIKSGVNIVNALEITSEICNNNIIQKEFYTSINWVKSGRNFSDAMKNMNLFNTLTISMMKIGEETGNLDNMLFKTTSILDEEVATYTSRLTELIQPIMIIIISLIIGGIVAAVIMPMFSIYGTI